MSRKGNPYDNAAIESFMKTLKYNEVYLKNYDTLTDVLRHLYRSGLSFAFYLEMSLVFIIGSFQAFFYFLRFKYGTIFNNI